MTRSITILLALVIDLTLGDPPNRFHPLLLMGRWLKWGRSVSPPQHRFWFGAGWTLAGLLLFALPWQILKTVNLHPLHKRSNFSLPPL